MSVHYVPCSALVFDPPKTTRLLPLQLVRTMSVDEDSVLIFYLVIDLENDLEMITATTILWYVCMYLCMYLCMYIFLESVDVLQGCCA